MCMVWNLVPNRKAMPEWWAYKVERANQSGMSKILLGSNFIITNYARIISLIYIQITTARHEVGVEAM